MFNIGPQELLLIMVLALLVVGPKRLPEIARSLGKGLREIRKAQDEVRKTIQVSLDEPANGHRAARALPADATGSDGEGSSTAAEPEAAAAPGDVEPEAAAAAGAATGAAAEETGVREISRTLGRSLAELRRAREEIQRSFRVDLEAPPPAKRPPPAERDSAAPGDAED
jgi:Tat protein translocase TatB subunit